MLLNTVFANVIYTTINADIPLVKATAVGRPPIGILSAAGSGVTITGSPTVAGWATTGLGFPALSGFIQ